MSIQLYNPFNPFIFNEKTCLLTGTKTDIALNLFPKWLLKEYQLAEKPFKLLDEQIVTYSDITIPCSETTQTAINALEVKICEAFTSGYEKVKALDQLNLFQWIGKLVYGMIHYEIRRAQNQQIVTGEPFNFSQSLIHKFENLHKMLQSLIQPFEFEGALPWTILVFPVKNPVDTFSYRDEINTLTFSLKMKDFGIIACLQDNGANLQYHQDIISKIEGKPLHPIQFEELCGRFFYSAYLFNRLPDYTFLPTNEAVYVESMPFYTISGKPLFDEWQNKTYGQVLENFWKPWNITLFEIIKNPEKPINFLLNEDDSVISPEVINSTIKALH